MAIPTSRPIFSDELVKATDLNRTPGQILDKALSRPVTIARNDEFFTLMRRDEISDIVNGADHTKKALELINAAFLALQDDEIDSAHPFGWLRAFDAEEVQELVAEVMATYRKAECASEYWEELEAVIHEWHESAIAVLSKDLADAWHSPNDEIPLTPPISELSHT